MECTLRPCILILFFRSLIHKGLMIQRIIFCCFNPKQITAGCLPDHTCHIFQVPHNLTVFLKPGFVSFYSFIIEKTSLPQKTRLVFQY